MITVLRMIGFHGERVFAPDSLIGWKTMKGIRITFPSKFKYCHIKPIQYTGEFWNKIDPYKIYPSLEAYYEALAKNEAHTAEDDPKPEKVAPVKATPRPNHPIKGDYVQLLENGQPSEDFTFVLQLIADIDEYFLIADVYEKEFKVIPLPERDNGKRKAFRVIL